MLLYLLPPSEFDMKSRNLLSRLPSASISSGFRLRCDVPVYVYIYEIFHSQTQAIILFCIVVYVRLFLCEIEHYSIKVVSGIKELVLYYTCSFTFIRIKHEIRALM